MPGIDVANPHPATEETPLIERTDGEAVGKDVSASVSESETLGYGLLLLAAVFFCLMTLLTRYLVAYTTFSVPSMVLVRGVTQGLLSLVTILTCMDFREVINVPRKYVPHIIARGLCGAASLSLNYKALSFVPLGITTCVLFFHPILTLMLSSVVLGERVGKRDMIAAALSFVGVVLVSNPTLSIDFTAVHSGGYALGVGLVFISSCVLSLAIVIIRSAGKAVHYMSLVTAYAFFVTLAGVAMGGANLNKLIQDPTSLGIALIASLLGFLGQALFNAGFQKCPAGTGSVVRSVDVPLAFVLALIFLHEVPHAMSIVGSMLVVGGVALVGLKQFGKK